MALFTALATQIISNDPERESFRQILVLKTDIENVIRKRADLIALSNDGIFLNQKLIAKKSSEILATLETILSRYSTFVISLGLKYLKQLFPDGNNILDLINKTSPKASTFIFGANSVLKSIRQRKEVFLYPRPRVAKLTQEFRSAIITHIKHRARELTRFSLVHELLD